MLGDMLGGNMREDMKCLGDKKDYVWERCDV